MNIKTAKEYVKNSINIYLKKDEFGDYRIPVERQRPIFLLGAPGIGKTAIMEQIASELGIALVSYSMTHHTRQSALGLPFITKKVYGGKEYDVSEYTMSEIIASVYETMESSGVKEGILFLDEINCVSETLAPSMLQFLQYKVFGKHQVPSGWVIVTAGNPPEFNKSVREFDIVTMDRLKILNVEADFKTWKAYAEDKGIHAAIISFLDSNNDYFYYMETTDRGREYVTARGWEDLAQVITMYEEDGMKVSESLVGQYLGNDKIVKEFTAYYELYNKYKKNYKVDEILDGTIDPKLLEAAIAKVGKAGLDERLSLVSMLLDTVISDMKTALELSDYLTDLMVPLKKVKAADEKFEAVVAAKKDRENIISSLKSANSLSSKDKRKHKMIIRFLDEVINELGGEADLFAAVKAKFDAEVNNMKAQVKKTDVRIKNLFKFAEEAFSNGNELLVITTEMTVNETSARYLAKYGSEDFRKVTELIMVSERQVDMRDKIKKLDLDD